MCFVICGVNLSVFAQKVDLKATYYVLPPTYSKLAAAQFTTQSITSWQTVNPSNVPVTAGKNWLAINVSNESAQRIDRVLVIEGRQFLLDEAMFISVEQQPLRPHPSEHRINNLIYSHLSLAAGERATVYIELNSRANNSVIFALNSESEFDAQLTFDYFSSGIAIGGILAIALVLAFVFLAATNQSILILTGYFSLLAINLAVMYGINLYSFYPEYPDVQGIEFPLFTSLSALLILWFCSELFELAVTRRKLYLVFLGAGCGMLVNIAVSLFLPFNLNLFICNLIHLAVTAFLLLLAIHLWKSQHRLAHLFMAFVVLQGAYSVLNVTLYGWFELNAEIYTLGYWLTGLLIIFIMARHASSEITEKHTAQREALENEMKSRKAQEELLALQEETQEQLEQRVQERTLELNIALQELEEANRELEQKNTLDELTGLFNRRFYDQKLTAEFRRSRRNLTPLSLIVIDIDHFKTINDTYGHSGGDKCLITLAQLIKQNVRRSSDIGCRYGGEEFCLILPETDTTGAIAIAEELRQKVIATEFTVEQQSISLTISCGISTYQQQAEATPIDVFNAADKALYQAKEHGRNQVKVQVISTAETSEL